MCGTKNTLWHCTLEILLLLLLLPLFPNQIIHFRLHNTKCVLWKKCVLLHSMEIHMNVLWNKLFTFTLLFPVKGIRFSSCWVLVINYSGNLWHSKIKWRDWKEPVKRNAKFISWLRCHRRFAMVLLTGQKNNLSEDEGGWWAGRKTMASVFLSPSGPHLRMRNLAIIR